MTVSAYVISIHAPREGSDQMAMDDAEQEAPFLSTLPARGATQLRPFRTFLEVISIHAPREGSDHPVRSIVPPLFISIHAPREGSDLVLDADPFHLLHNFYPRSPRGERHLQSAFMRCTSGFLSTLPARGATVLVFQAADKGQISIHAPREGSDRRHRLQGDGSFISIHAPREGSDGLCDEMGGYMWDISIHAPREGSDRMRPRGRGGTRDFYPRSPRGERPTSQIQRRGRRDFYPRSPRGERPPHRAPDGALLGHFYPRSPRGERPTVSIGTTGSCNFYPRSPRGERLSTCEASTGSLIFLSTLPARGATYCPECRAEVNRISIHAPREGSDSRPIWGWCSTAGFLSTLPARGATGRRCAGRCAVQHFYPRSPRGERRGPEAPARPF